MSFSMKNLVSLYLLRKHKQLFQYSLLKLFLNCSSLISSVSLTVFIKCFFIQKSKSTNLNHKRRKTRGSNYQLKYYDF